MGCGASVVRPTANSTKSSNPPGRQTTAKTLPHEVPTLMASLQGHMPNTTIQDEEETKMTYKIDIVDGSFPKQMSQRIECDDLIVFEIDGEDEYDIFQVYRDGNDYYRIDNGYELLSISSLTPEEDRRILLSFALNQAETEFYFCVIPSSQREIISTNRKCPKVNCETNCLKIRKSEIKFSLTDEKESQKVYLHKGDTIEMEWSSKSNSTYRVEERKYCPVSGGLYTVDKAPNRPLSRGKFSQKFNDFGMSFLFRLTSTNEVHDITVCIINETYKIKHIEITDTVIQPNIIWIEQGDWIVFEWNTKRKQTIVQIEPYTIDENKRESIELKTDGEHFFWPNESTRRGFMYHQFNETGLYCYKTGNNQIGTIIVEPHKTIHHVPIFGDQSIYTSSTKDLIQFDWKMSDSQEEPILITIDSQSSVVPDAINGLTGIFDCSMHKCTKVEPFFRHHFHTCETYLLNIPQHGLYNISHSDNRDNILLSVIIENGIDSHRVVYNEKNEFEPNTVIINRLDQVWFDSSSTDISSIYQTDENGSRAENEKAIFAPQKNSINYFMKDFQQIGIYYFTTDINNEDPQKRQKSSSPPLAIVVIPDIRFHYISIRQNHFDTGTIIANVNDFVFWQFEQTISRNVIQLGTDATLKDLISSHERAVTGRNRLCLAIECTVNGTFFFANPEFERIFGSDQERLISTIIIDPAFMRNCFIVTNREFIPQVLHIEQNDTVSWTLSNNEQNHRIYVESIENKREIDEDNFIDRHIAAYIHDVNYLYTFNQPGQFTVRSEQFQNIATVHVYSNSTIRSQKRRVQEPQITGDIPNVSQFGTRIYLDCPNRNASIYYTLDGSLPTRHSDNVHEYNPDEGVLLIEPGLHLVRAYSTEDNKLASDIITSRLTFVMENKEIKALNERRALWNSCQISLLGSLQYPNKLYGKIEIEPTSSIDLIDHFELYIDDIAQAVNISPKNLQFSAIGFAGGEQYEVYIVAYPKNDIDELEPILSNKRAFEIRRETEDGAPLVSLAVTKEPNTIFLMWAHIGDSVSEYSVYVDDIETKTISEKDFNDFYGIQFQGAQQRKKYLLHVTAKLKNGGKITKSNVIPVILPLERPIKGAPDDRYFAYITINAETPPSDMRLDKGSDRLPSPKLSVKKSSCSLPPSSPPPTASSRPSVHLIDMNNPTKSTSETIAQKSYHDHDNNLKTEQQLRLPSNNASTQTKDDENTKKPSTKRRNKNGEQSQEKTNPDESVLSDHAKSRAQTLLKMLTRAIEDRSEQSNSIHTHPHSTCLPAQHHENDQSVSQRSSHDPYTRNRPPKSQRSSLSMNKNPHPTDNDTS